MKFYPPLMVLACVVVQFIMNRFLPTPDILPDWAGGVGYLLIIAGVAVIISIKLKFDEAETSIMPDGEPTALLDQGLFAYSRNPIYVTMAFIVAGSALAIGTLYGLLMVPVFIIAVNKVWIESEEKNLEAALGDAYLDYKARVNRWI